MHFDNLGWLDEAVEIDYLNKSMDRQGQPIKYIVLHGTAGGSSAQAIGEYFRDSNVDASAHFVIGQDGTIVQGVNVLAAAWGNGVLTAGHAAYLPENINPNLYSVSIEHVKPSTDNSDQLTSAQAQNSSELIQRLCDTYNIPKHAGDTSGGVISHADIDPINRSRCPGSYPWNNLWAYLKGDSSEVLSISQASQYFIETVKDQRWHCKSTGYDVADAILKYYQTCTATGLNGLSQYGLPTSGEQPHPTKKGVTYQEFERGVIVYDPTHADDSVLGISGACYPGHLDRFVKVATPTNITSTINTLSTAQVTAQALSNAIAKSIADLKG